MALEGKYAELSEGQTFTNIPVAIKEVRASHGESTASCFHQQSAPLSLNVCFFFFTLGNSSDRYAHCST